MNKIIWSQFKVRVPAKWVLAGEHAVLRGAYAVALPYFDVGLTLGFEPNWGEELHIEPLAVRTFMLDLLHSIQIFWESKGGVFSNPMGTLQIQSDIPMAAGLGSSAALCVALTRWMVSSKMLALVNLTEFATELEHRFHGKSSGMDVAVIAAGEPISFGMERGVQSIGVKRLPKFSLHDTGLRSRTSDCVLKVEKFREQIPVEGQRLDQEMSTASEWAQEGLIRYDRGEEEEGLKLIQKAMKQAGECFYAWDLVPADAKKMEKELLHQGALAVKMTGAGGGGMLVALWGKSE